MNLMALFCRICIGCMCDFTAAPHNSTPYNKCGCINEKYSWRFNFVGILCFTLFNVPKALEIFVRILAICGFHVSLLSIIIPRRFMLSCIYIQPDCGFEYYPMIKCY